MSKNSGLIVDLVSWPVQGSASSLNRMPAPGFAITTAAVGGTSDVLSRRTATPETSVYQEVRTSHVSALMHDLPEQLAAMVFTAPSSRVLIAV